MPTTPSAPDTATRTTRAAAPKPTTARFWLLKAAVVAAVLLVANAAAAVVGPRLSPTLDFNNPIAQAKHDQIEARRVDRCTDLVIAGASVASYGIDPERLTAQLGDVDAYNAALFGSLLDVETDWLERFVLPELDPATVVYVLPTAVFHTDSAGLAFNLDEWQHARATRTGLLADADRTAADLLPLYRYREQLTDADQMLRWFNGRPAVETTGLGDASLRASGFTTKPGVWNPAGARAPQDRVILDRRYESWDLDPGELDALATFSADALAAGTQVVYVLPPMSAANIEAHPGGQADIDRYRSAVQQAGATAGVPVIDLSGLALPDDDYADPIHLSERGAQALTDALAAELARQGLGTAPCTG
jgi:hypothetical protein